MYVCCMYKPGNELTEKVHPPFTFILLYVPFPFAKGLHDCINSPYQHTQH